MDFGFYLPCYWPDTSLPAQHLYREMIREAQFAEELGYASVSVPEHHFINYLVHPSPLMTAVRVAAATKHIPIITAIIVLPFYDVRRLAGEIAQADCMTDGRLQLGVGRGAFRYEFDRFDVRVEDSREIFDESLEILMKLLSETDVSWEGKHYRFAALTVTPRPVQKPHPPIWIAALNQGSIAGSVARGFHVLTTPLRDPFEAAKMQASAFHEAVEKNGEAARGRKLSMLRMGFVTKDERDKREKVQLAHSNHRRFATVFETPGDVRGGAIQPMDVDVTPEQVEENLIIGSPQECVDKLAKYDGLGIHNIQVNMNFGACHRDVIDSLEVFATKVAPHFS